MIAVLGLLIILASAGGLTGVLSTTAIGWMGWLAIGVVGGILLCVGVDFNPQPKTRNGNVRRRG